MSQLTELYDKRARAIWAYTYNRQDYELFEAAQAADDKLVSYIASKRKHPPTPKPGFVFEDKQYIRQSWVNGNARYVLLENFDEDEIRLELPTHDLVVRREISAMTVINEQLEILNIMGVDPFSDEQLNVDVSG